MIRDVRPLLAPLLGAVLLVTGCAETPPPNFYILSSMPPEAAESLGANEDKLALGVGPAELPGYLDRPQVVALASSNKLELAEFHKWAEPLDDNLSRVLAENLSVLLATDEVVRLPQRRPVPIDYQVSVRVLRFDADLDGTAVLVARWNILDEDGRTLLVSRKSSFTESSTPGSDREAVVAAMSRTVADLSRKIASEVRALGSR